MVDYTAEPRLIEMWQRMATRTPGPSTIKEVGGVPCGDMVNGCYFGTVTPAEIFGTGLNNDSIVGNVTGGVEGNGNGYNFSGTNMPDHTTTPWLKFGYMGKILFVSQKPLKYNTSWNHINACLGSVDGSSQNARRVFRGIGYKVRLMTGTLRSPYEAENTSGGEWNALIYGVHSSNPDGRSPQWDTFSDADIVVASGNGRGSWTQEVSSLSSGHRVNRGLSSVATLNPGTASSTGTHGGLRLVLESLN